MAKSSSEKKKKVLRNRLFTVIFIVLVIFSSIFVSFLLQSGSPFFLQIAANNAEIVTPQYNYSEIHKGQKIIFELKSGFSYLGIVSMRFNTFGRINDDILVFRVKEKGDSRWYYQNKYKTDQFQDNELFPFGFPPIRDSRGKTYVFEIESMRGKPGNAVALSKATPQISSTYQYSQQRFLSLKLEGIEFIFFKYMQGLGSIEKDLIVFSPFILFVFYKLFVKRDNKSSIMRLAFGFLIFITLFYILLLGRVLPGEQTNNIYVTLLLFAAWIVFILKYNVESRIWLLFAAATIAMIPPVLIILRRPDVADRVGVMGYGFLILSVVHGVIEVFFKQVSKMDLYEFFHMLIPKNLKEKLRVR